MRISLPYREKPCDLDVNMEAWSENRKRDPGQSPVIGQEGYSWISDSEFQLESNP